MTQKTFQTIKAGQTVRLTQDAGILSMHGVPTRQAGKEVVITKADPGNNKMVYVDAAYGSEVYLLPEDIMEIVDKSGKTAKFCKKSVEEIMILGANNLLKNEMTARIQTARTALQAAGAIKDHKEQMKIVAEQLRQIKLIRAAIRENITK